MQEMIERLRVYGNKYGKTALTDTEAKSLAAFLDNLPTVPPKYTWDGTIREAKSFEYYLIGGCVHHWTREEPTKHAYPILRKIEPKFKPGEIVRDATGACGIVGKNGELLSLLGKPMGISLSDRDACRKATYKDIQKFMERELVYVTDVLCNLLGDKYGGGEGERDDNG